MDKLMRRTIRETLVDMDSDFAITVTAEKFCNADAITHDGVQMLDKCFDMSEALFMPVIIVDNEGQLLCYFALEVQGDWDGTAVGFYDAKQSVLTESPIERIGTDKTEAEIKQWMYDKVFFNFVHFNG